MLPTRLSRLAATTLGFALVALVAIAAPAEAQRVIWFIDGFAGDDALPGALASIPGLTVHAATDDIDFSTQLTSNPWDLVIFGEDRNNTFPFVGPALMTFLSGGGRMLGVTWQNSDMAGLFQAAVVSSNQSLISGSGALFAGVTPPVVLSNPGWTTFSQGYTGAGACDATFEDGSCAALEGNDSRTLLLGPMFDAYGTGTDEANGQVFLENAVEHFLVGVQTTQSVTPEPATLGLVATGFGGLIVVARRRRKRDRQLRPPTASPSE